MTLKLCSLSARGLWVEMLAIMGISEKIGFLQIGGKPITNEQLAVMAGVPVDQVIPLIKELEDNGVFSRDNSGVPYCRRMAREGIDYAKARAYGKQGGNPALKEESRIHNQNLEATEGLTPTLNPTLNPNDDKVVKSHKRVKYSTVTPDQITPTMLRIGSWFKRRPTTLWTLEEYKALPPPENMTPEVMDMVEQFYFFKHPSGKDFRRRNIITMLNNWNAEVDKVTRWIAEGGNQKRITC